MRVGAQQYFSSTSRAGRTSCVHRDLSFLIVVSLSSKDHNGRFGVLGAALPSGEF